MFWREILKTLVGASHGIVGCLFENGELVRNLAAREIEMRFKGSVLGIGWYLVTPLFMLAVYTTVFGFIFMARAPDLASGETVSFALWLFLGLMIYDLFTECIGRAPGLVMESAAYVKKIVFPLEILPWISLLTAFFGFAIKLFVLLLALLVTMGRLHLELLLLPIILLPLALLVLGLSWMLSATGVYLRDTRQFTGMLLPALIFLSPIFYSVESAPDFMRVVLAYNPLSFIITASRDLLLQGRLPPLDNLLQSYGICWLVALAGLACFRLLRRGFADVI